MRGIGLQCPGRLPSASTPSVAVWWLIWDGPEQPEGTGYQIVALKGCDAERGIVDFCRLPSGHGGDHRW